MGVLGQHNAQVLGDCLLVVDGDVVHHQLADERLQSELEILHCLTIAELEVVVLLPQLLCLPFLCAIRTDASQASLAVFFVPSDSRYSCGMEARIASIAKQSSSSSSVPWSIAFQSRRQSSRRR